MGHGSTRNVMYRVQYKSMYDEEITPEIGMREVQRVGVRHCSSTPSGASASEPRVEIRSSRSNFRRSHRQDHNISQPSPTISINTDKMGGVTVKDVEVRDRRLHDRIQQQRINTPTGAEVHPRIFRCELSMGANNCSFF